MRKEESSRSEQRQLTVVGLGKRIRVRLMQINKILCRADHNWVLPPTYTCACIRRRNGRELRIIIIDKGDQQCVQERLYRSVILQLV